MNKIAEYFCIGLLSAVCVLATQLGLEYAFPPSRAEVLSEVVYAREAVEKQDMEMNHFFAALWRVESGGRHGAVLGDNGRSRGPLQISWAYWQDACLLDPHAHLFFYEDVDNIWYAVHVAKYYFKRWAPEAWEARDWETLARVHNGGPHGATKEATIAYADKVLDAIASMRATN